MLGSSRSYQTVWTDPVLPLWLPRGMTPQDQRRLPVPLEMAKTEVRPMKDVVFMSRETVNSEQSQKSSHRSWNYQGLPGINNPSFYDSRWNRIHSSTSQPTRVFFAHATASIARLFGLMSQIPMKMNMMCRPYCTADTVRERERMLSTSSCISLKHGMSSPSCSSTILYDALYLVDRFILFFWNVM